MSDSVLILTRAGRFPVVRYGGNAMINTFSLLLMLSGAAVMFASSMSYHAAALGLVGLGCFVVGAAFGLLSLIAKSY